MKDKKRASILKKALKKLVEAQDLIEQGLPATEYQSKMIFKLHCQAVDLEQNVNYYAYGEVDPVR